EKVSDSRGTYLFTLLPPGSYKMTVELAGFQTSVRSGMGLQVQQQANVDVVLNVGDLTTRVEVAGEAPRLDAVSATLGRVVENRCTGRAVVNCVTRSGTNQMHGSLFDFLRNSALNATSFCSTRNGRPIVASRRNQFGGAVGGPVYIPKVYNGRNKTFFFFHHEGTKVSSQTTSTQTLPSILEKNGDFSQTLDANGRLLQIFDPYSVSTASGAPLRTLFPGNVIPQSRFNPVAVAAITFYPDPNHPGLPFTHTSN